jgi:hypothetical protein
VTVTRLPAGICCPIGHESLSWYTSRVRRVARVIGHREHLQAIGPVAIAQVLACPSLTREDALRDLDCLTGRGDSGAASTLTATA